MIAARLPGSFRTIRTAAVVLPLALLTACSSSHAGPGNGGDLRVPECEAYAQRVASCFHRDDLAGVIATRAHSEEERDRIRAVCSLNLQRLTAACR